MISNELLEEVINVSNKGKFISKGLLIRIVINSIEQLDYISKSNFQEIRIVNLENDFGIATYCKDTGVIELDYNALIRQELNSKAFIYLKSNLSIIQNVLHEVEHLDELSKKRKNDIQSKLISISDSDFLTDIIYQFAKKRKISEKLMVSYIKRKANIFDEKYWHITPIEKIAEADSYKNIINSLDNYPNFYELHKSIYNSIYIEYLDSLKIGYKYNKEKEKYDVPIFEYIRALRYLEYKLNLRYIGVVLSSEIINNLNYLDKFKYGFPVTDVDIENIKKQKINRKNNLF